jgi:hypothetical protein
MAKRKKKYSRSSVLKTRAYKLNVGKTVLLDGRRASTLMTNYKRWSDLPKGFLLSMRTRKSGDVVVTRVS